MTGFPEIQEFFAVYQKEYERLRRDQQTDDWPETEGDASWLREYSLQSPKLTEKELDRTSCLSVFRSDPVARPDAR
jgi:hypothetical protein